MKTSILAMLVLIASATPLTFAQTEDLCITNPAACQQAPQPSNCPEGSHWTLEGTGIAHCVPNEPPK